jgi:hypothetical protein
MKTVSRIIVGLIVAYFAGGAAAQASAPVPAPSSTPVASPASSPAVGEVAQPAPPTAEAGPNNAPKLSLMFSPYTLHFNPKPTHRRVVLLGVEREHANAKLDGLVLFTNSFGQPSIYVYPFGGVYKSIFGINDVSFKWTGGLIYGYKGEFKDEVANVGGIAPVLIFGLNYQIKPGWSFQVNTLGKAAAQFQLNAPLNF